MVFNQKQQKLLQVWQVSGKHKNASNDCKSVNDLCNQLQGTQPWCDLATARGTWGQLAQGGFHPPVPQASQPQHESGIIQLCQQVARMARAQPGHALQLLPCREAFGSLCIDSCNAPGSSTLQPGFTLLLPGMRPGDVCCRASAWSCVTAVARVVASCCSRKAAATPAAVTSIGTTLHQQKSH